MTWPGQCFPKSYAKDAQKHRKSSAWFAQSFGYYLKKNYTISCGCCMLHGPRELRGHKNASLRGFGSCLACLAPNSSLEVRQGRAKWPAPHLTESGWRPITAQVKANFSSRAEKKLFCGVWFQQNREMWILRTRRNAVMFSFFTFEIISLCHF